MYTNIDTLTKTKKNILETEIAKTLPDVICLTEVLPKNSIYERTEEFLKIEGYNRITHEENKRGTSIYTANHIQANCIETKTKYSESVWIEIPVKNEKAILGCIYRSPSSTVENNNNLQSLLEEVSNIGHDYLIIVGDFNCKEIDWPTKTVLVNEDHISYQIFDKLNDLFLTQHVMEPTRFRVGNKPSMFDWIVSEHEHTIENIRVNEPIGISDHAVLNFSIGINTHEDDGVTRLAYFRGNYEQFRNDLEAIEWEEIFHEKTVQENWDFFQNTVTGLIEKHIPKKRYLSKKKPPWMGRDLDKKIKKKHQAWDKYKRNKSKENWENYTHFRNIATNSVNDAKKKFEHKIIHEVKTNPKNFWNYVKYKTKTKSNIAGLENNQGDIVNEDKQKAEIFNQYFSSVFTDEETSNIPSIEVEGDFPTLDSISFTTEDIVSLLDKLGTSKAAGPDGIHSKVLKECKSQIAPALSLIYGQSLQEAVIPTQWKEAHVKPIFKKGKKKQAKNYRPVSLTAICCKVLEKIVRNSIVGHLEKLGILAKEQFGFRERRSCNTQLLEIMEIWSNFLDNGVPWDCIYLDFAKAFDSVPHQRLLKKIESYNIKGNLLNWITDFLSNRKQWVVIGKEKSSWTSVKSGIPQGSVLGPILFIIFINDLPKLVTSYTRIFADDTKIFKAIESMDDTKVLQNDLIELANWSKKWQLPFNESKCKVIHFGKKNPHQSYNMNNIQLEAVSEEKDPGITFDPDLKFGPHIRNIISKANSRVGLIKNTFEDLQPQNFKILYKSLVRPILEYCSSVWYPILVRDMKEIEKVQKRATKLVKGISDWTYEERLKHLDIPTMEYRRRRTDMLQVFRILKNLDDLDADHFFELDSQGVTRGHSLKIRKPRASSKLRLNSFSHRVVNPWNSLSEEVVSADSLNCFKDRLERKWKFDQYKYLPSFPLP